MIRRMIQVNKRVCGRMAPYLPQATPHFESLYLDRVAECMNAKPNQLVVDVGGGRSCRFAGRRIPELGNRIIAVDISEAELRRNQDVDECRVADIMSGLPFEDESVDLIVSRSVLEHLESQERFIAASYRVLKPGGRCVHFFPSRFALFALINQALPDRLSRRLVLGLHEGKEGILGFPARYDKTWYSPFTKLMGDAGFTVERVDVGYYQSGYFSFCVPLFLLSALYEMGVRALGLRFLAAYLIVSARKDEPGERG